MSSRRLKLDVGPPSPRKPLTGQRSFRSTTTALSSPRTVGEAKADAPAADVPGSPARRAAARSESKGGVSGTTTPKRGAVGKYHTRRGRQAQQRKAAGNKKQGSKRDGQRAATDLDEEAGPERRRFNAMRLADDGCVPVRELRGRHVVMCVSVVSSQVFPTLSRAGDCSRGNRAVVGP